MRAYLSIVFLLVFASSCKVYSFTGANIDPNIKSMSIEYIYNKSGNGPASASDIFTNTLKDKMLINTSLKQVNQGGDLVFSGDIVSYNYTIQAPTGNLSSDLRRVTITVKINLINNLNPTEGFEQQQFTRFADYPVTEDLSAIEENLIREISLQLVDDIFNKAFVKW